VKKMLTQLRRVRLLKTEAGTLAMSPDLEGLNFLRKKTPLTSGTAEVHLVACSRLADFVRLALKQMT
jgi:hypothetical protein